MNIPVIIFFGIAYISAKGIALDDPEKIIKKNATDKELVWISRATVAVIIFSIILPAPAEVRSKAREGIKQLERK